MTPKQLMVVFAFINVSALAWMIATDPGEGRVVRFELAGSVESAKPLVDEFNGDVWSRMRESFHRDSLFLFSYTGFFLATGLFFGPASGKWSWAVVLLALATGICDVMENTHALGALSRPWEGHSDALLAAMRGWSRMKWGLLGLLTLSLAYADWNWLRNVWGKAATVCFAVSGAGYTLGIAIPDLIFRREFFLAIAFGILAQLAAVLFPTPPTRSLSPS
jgi:hypothetical protein